MEGYKCSLNFKNKITMCEGSTFFEFLNVYSPIYLTYLICMVVCGQFYVFCKSYSIWVKLARFIDIHFCHVCFLVWLQLKILFTLKLKLYEHVWYILSVEWIHASYQWAFFRLDLWNFSRRILQSSVGIFVIPIQMVFRKKVNGYLVASL